VKDKYGDEDEESSSSSESEDEDAEVWKAVSKVVLK